MDITFYIALASAILSAAVGVLVVVAPKTATKKDDEWLERLETLEKVIEGLVKK